MSISYTNAPVKVRDNIIAAHNRAWNRIAQGGAWFDGKNPRRDRRGNSASSKCALCSRRKEALSPYNIDGRHDGLGTLPERLIEQGVPMIDPKDLEGELDTVEEQSLASYWAGVPSNIRRALSVAPEEAYEWFRLVEVQYPPGKAMRDFASEYRAITHAQIELIAGRVSVLN